MRTLLQRLPLLSLALLPTVASAQVTNADIPRDNLRSRFVMYGVAPTKPILFAPIRKIFYIANQLGDRLAVYSTKTQELLFQVPTGSGLASLKLRPGTTELWMVDRVTSSLTVYDTAAGRIVRTVRVGAEPHDVVFTADGDRAYVSCSAVNRVDVVDTATYQVVHSIAIPARQPRAMVRLGNAVYVTSMLSGNGTAPFSDSGLGEPTSVVRASDIPGALALPDRDLLKISITAAAATDHLDPAATVTGLGTTLFNVAVRPGTNELWIPNTDALNADHRGAASFIQGQVVSNRITIVDPTQSPVSVRIIDMDNLAPSAAERASTPTSASFTPDGSRAFITGYGVDRVAVLDIDDQGNVSWAGSITIPPVGIYPEFSGPRSSAVSPDGRYLVTYNKVDNAFSRIDLQDLPTSTPFGYAFDDSRHIGYDRMPLAMKRGRGFFDNTKTSASNTSSCFSCHTDGDTDGLAWDLSDYLDPEDTPPDQLQFGVAVKGPMVTQGCRALREIGPYHWRGEQGKLGEINGAFIGLFENSENGEPATIGGHFVYLAGYLEELALAPNPLQPLDRQYTPEQLEGADIFLTKPVQGAETCGDCHTLPLGTSNEIVQTFRGGEAPSIVVPQLRAVQRKLTTPMDLGATLGERTELGAGLEHGGAAPTIEHVALELDENGNQLFLVTPSEATKLAEFIKALDTGLAPSTGFQVTMHAGNSAGVVANELAFLMAQADAGHCDLVYAGGPEYLFERTEFVTGMYRPETGEFAQASVLLPDLTVSDLVAKAQQGRPVTFFGVARLRGKVMGIDRDNDNVLDLDEFLAGTDPENSDTDGDGYPDGYEEQWGMDPLVENTSSPDSEAPTVTDGPHVVYRTQTSAKFEFETSEPARVFFHVDGQPVLRRPLDHEFDTQFSHTIGGLEAQTIHSITLDITDPDENHSTLVFDHETASFVRPAPVHVERIETRLLRDARGLAESKLRVRVHLGNGAAPAASGYDVEISVYYTSPQGMSVIASERHSISGGAGHAGFNVRIPSTTPTGGELIVVVQEVIAPDGFPSFVEADNATGMATQAY